MAEVKVRYALVSYTKPDMYDQPYTAFAFRGEIVDIPNERELQRMRELGAVVDADVELERPGTLIQLPESPSDEEIINWVGNAAPDEIRRLASERPNLVARIVGAQEIVNRNARERLELLGRAADVARAHLGDAVPAGVQSGVAGPEKFGFSTPLDTDVHFGPAPQPAAGGGDTSVPGDETAGASGDTSGGPIAGTNPDGTAIDSGGAEGDGTTEQTGGDGGLSGGGPAPVDVEYYDGIVRGNREVVTDYISTHPREYRQILEAENRLAASEGRDPRVSVLRAAEAAAAHTD